MTSKTVDKELAFLLMEFDTLPIMTKLKSEFSCLPLPCMRS